ncbi:DNA double-strand break repair protein isoform X3 [Wolffia australiana]
MDFERWTANSSSEREPEYLLEDCRCVLSDILEEEAVFEKKRRCLTGSTMESRIFPKSAKVVESLINSYIPESYIRNDDDSLENMRLLIKNTTVNPFPGDSMPDEPAVRTIDLEKNSCDLRPETTNWYQGLVNISDDASMVAYKVINLLLEKLMREEGSSRPEGIALADLLWAVGEITPSFPKSVIEKFENSLRSSS